MQKAAFEERFLIKRGIPSIVAGALARRAEGFGREEGKGRAKGETREGEGEGAGIQV